MELDENGRRFEKFRRDLPYELGVGAYLDEPDGSQYGVRYSHTVHCFALGCRVLQPIGAATNLLPISVDEGPSEMSSPSGGAWFTVGETTCSGLE
jgi:hypothetical protein